MQTKKTNNMANIFETTQRQIERKPIEQTVKAEIFVCDITYSGIRQITPVKAEYKHTGEIHELIKRGQAVKHTDSAEIAENWRAKGGRVKTIDGYYFIHRLAIPTITASGERDWWYINNPNDNYHIHKVSKYGKKIHATLSKIQKPISKT